jgi:hypothetical protein
MQLSIHGVCYSLPVVFHLIMEEEAYVLSFLLGANVSKMSLIFCMCIFLHIKMSLVCGGTCDETCQGDIAPKILVFLDYWGLVQSSWYVCFAESGFGECWSEVKQAGCYWGTTQPNFSYRLSITCRILPWLSMLFFIGGSKFHKCTSWIKVWTWTNAQELQRLALLWDF